MQFEGGVNLGISNQTRSKWIFLVIAGVAFVTKVPFAVQWFRLYPDAIAYLNIARNCSTGKGFTSTLKLNYFDSSAVSHNALSDWPPLYPLFASSVLKVASNEIVLQVANALLIGIAAGLVFLLGERLFDRRTGLVAGLFAAIAPSLFRAGITAMSDPLGLVLCLWALLIAISAGSKGGQWAAVGMIIGAAYLARFNNAVLLLPFILLLGAKSGRRCNLLLCIAGFAVVTGPILAWKWVLFGSPYYSVQIVHYQTQSFRHSSWQYGAGLSTGMGDYLLHNLPVVASAVWRNTRIYASSLFLSTGGLFLLSCFLPVVVFKLRAKILTGGRGLLLTVAVMQFAVCALTWSILPVRDSRLLMVSYCLLLPFCAAGVSMALDSRNTMLSLSLPELSGCAFIARQGPGN